MTDAMEEQQNGLPLQKMVREFYHKHGLPIRGRAGLVFDPEEVEQMRDLLKEEVDELYRAIDDGNLIKVVDGLADVVYVAYGMSLQYGIDLDKAIAAVHNSNMTKDGGRGALFRKVARGDDYSPPDLTDVIVDVADDD